MRASWRAFLLVFVLIGLAPAVAKAQSHWGVSFSGTPRWELASQLKEVLEGDDAVVDIKGSEVTVGIVRGSKLGGDWGVSFVHKPFKDGSSAVDSDEDCFQSTCLPRTETNVFQNVKLTGVEVHWFARFVNIKERVQIGLNIAGGVASVSGQIIQTNDFFEVTNFDPRTGTITASPRRTVDTLDASEELLSVFPLAKVEVAGSVILARGLKVKLSGGLNFPAFSARIGLVYLIGAR
jgi:hypothetical protein